MPDKATQQRLDAMKVSPGVYKAMAPLQAYVESCGLERPLLKLVEIRASQINGCAFCLAMHTKDARKLGESDERMHLLDAWHEAPVFTARERAALAWTEAVTLINKHHAPDDVYDEARRHFSEKELVDLTAAVIAINGWNRAAIAFRATPQLEQSKIAA
jgi:AhpD family alkylhydroperoxidase